MARRRAAGLLLALAACIATATAAPTASNHTSLDLYDGAPEGCYYNFQHYGEGDRIMTNEPCLNCTCHNRMLMCYLKVCPFTKAIGQDCTIEKRADQCCPIVTCPDVPVDLLTSTTTSPAEYGPTGMGKLDKFGCSINGKYFSEGSKVPPAPNKPCEHCYCIRNMTTCVMQECTLHVDGCTPIYHKDVCCPVRYSCDHPEDEMPLLDDLSTTVRPTPGFLLTTTTVAPVTQMSQDCVYENNIFPDGALIKTEKACDHCYCMKGDIVCVVQECGTPMENEGKNCTALPPREGVCCPDTYICEGDEPTTGNIDAYDRTTITLQEEPITLSPPRRTNSEGSGYRNEPDEIPYTEQPVFEPEVEGSGDEEDFNKRTEITPESVTYGLTDDLLSITEESHEYIPLTTSKPTDVPEITTAAVFDKDEDKVSNDKLAEGSFESQPTTPSKIDEYTVKEISEAVTDVPYSHEIGSGEPDENNLNPDEEIPATPTAPIIEQHDVTTEIDGQDTSGIYDKDESSEPILPVVNASVKDDEKISTPSDLTVTGDTDVKATTTSSIVHDFTSAPGVEVAETTDSKDMSETMDISKITTEQPHIIESDVIPTTTSAEPSVISGVTSNVVSEGDVEPQVSTLNPIVPNLDDEFVTTESPESQDQDVATESSKETKISEPPKHVTANTPMLEEIENDSGTEHIHNDVTPDDTSKIFTTSLPHITSIDNQAATVTEEQTLSEDNILGTTVNYDHEVTPTEAHKTPEVSTEFSNKEIEQEYASKPSTSISQESEEAVTVSDNEHTIVTQDQSNLQDVSRPTTVSTLETKDSTTEPDKGLNTIPSSAIEEDILSPHEEYKTTISDETTESEIDHRLSDEIGSKATTASAVVESTTLATESTYRKEDNQPTTDSQESPKLTTEKPEITKDELSTLIQDYAKTTEADLNLQQEITTTSSPKYTVNEDYTTYAAAVTPSSQSYIPESTVTEKEQETATSASNEYVPLTTEENQEDNEIFNEPRIPGEGDCLLNGITYTNESAVPSSNNCQSGCKCISSIIKCDPILCSLPPEMDNCETIYDSPDACCPTYVCDHRSETNAPQSHSQMSGTELPIAPPISCQGDECVINEQVHQQKPSTDCKSGICPSKTDVLQIDSTVPHIPEQLECVGDKCEPVKCSGENGCQSTPCEGENCNIAPSVIPSESKPCSESGDCNIQNIPSKDCSAGECVNSDAHSDDTQPKETCKDKKDCQNIPVSDVSTFDQNVSGPCPGSDCKKPQTEGETSTASILDHTVLEDLDKDTEKQTIGVTETSDKHETSTILSEHIDSSENSELPVNVQSVDITTQPSVVYNEEEYSTDEPAILIEENKTIAPILEEISPEQPVIIVTPGIPDAHDTKTEQPELFSIEKTTKESQEMETVTASVATNVEISTISPETEPSRTDSQQQTDRVETIIHDHPETSTEPVSYSSHDLTSPSDEILIQNTEKSIIEPHDNDSQVIPDSTVKYIESSTEPSQIYVTQPNETTELQEIIHYDTTAQTSLGENITEPPKSHIDSEPENTNKETQKEISTETPVLEVSSTESLAHDDNDQDVTSIPILSDKENTTMKESEETELSIESQGVTKPGEGEPEYTDSSQELTTVPSKLHATETQEITKPFIEYIPKEDDGSESSKTGGAESATESIEKATTPLISEETSSEPLKPFDMIPQEMSTSHAEIDREATTEPPKVFIPEPHETPLSPEGTYQESATTTKIEPSTGEPEIKATDSNPEIPVTTEEVGLEVITSNIKEEPITEPPKTYSTEHMEPQSPADINRESTTEKVIEEYVTEPSKSSQTESQDATTNPAEGYEEYTTTSKLLSDETSTELSQTDITKIQEISQTPEIGEHGTTIKATESTTEHIDISTEAAIQSITDNEIPKPTEIETPKEDDDKIQESPDITTSQELLTPEPVEITTPTIILDGNRRTESEPLEPDTTTKIPSIQVSQSELSGISDSNLGEQKTTTPSDLIKDLETTITPMVVDSEQPYTESAPGLPELVKRPESDSHVTTLRPMTGEKDESQPDLQETMNTQSMPSDAIMDDDLKTTTSVKQELSTLNPIEASKEPSDNEVNTEYPVHYTPQEELTVSQESSTEGVFTDTQKPEHAFKPELPATVTVPSTISDSTTEISQLSSDKPSDGTYSEQPTSGIEDSKYPSDITSGYDTTKTSIDQIATTVQPVLQEMDETVKVEDGKEESPINEHERSTQTSDLESESITQVPIQVTSGEPEDDKSHLPDQDKVDLTSPSSELPDAIASEPTESVTSAEYKPTEEEINTESPVFIKTTISSSGLPSGEITTVASDTPMTDTQASVDIQKIPSEPSSPTTETSEVETIAVEHTLEPQRGVSESDTELTNDSEIQPDGTKPSEPETLETSSPSSVTEEALEIEKKTTVSEEHDTISISTSSPLEIEQQTVKELDVITSDQHTTETLRVTDSTDAPSSSEIYPEKPPESIQTITPQKETPTEEYPTTLKPHKPDEYETASDISTQGPVAIAEELTTPSQDISPAEHITADQEQSIPVIISDEVKTTPSKESDTIQTERVTAATEKPSQETAGPEEEFILATSKPPPTTVKVEEEVPTSLPSVETTSKPTDKPAEPQVTTSPEQPKPISTETQPTDEIIPDEEGSFPPSGTSGYGQEPDYVEEDQTFGPGTCRYGGKVYVSAQQIPRDDPCDFCFCFRSDIICLQQSCPPPIHGCHEEPIQGFCCPRYECPVSMATTVNVTTTTTTTTTTLPPHFPTHSYKGSAQRRGCQIKGQIYKVGEVVRASSGPCLHCTCGGDGQMKCDPKVCTPEPMLRQMIAAAVSAKRRR